jgi:hypothetical protein
MKIFYDYVQIKEVLGFTNVNNELVTIEPYVTRAAREIVLTVLGETLLTRLVAKAEEESFDTDFEEKIWLLIKKATANYAYYLFVDDGAVQVDESGVYRMEDGERKSAYQNQVRPFKEARHTAAYAALYDMAVLAYKEQNEDWLADTNRISYEKMLLWKMEDFHKTRSLESWYSFFSLSGQMDYVLDKYILPVIGAQKYDELVIEVKTNGAETSDNLALLKSIRAVLAHYSIIEATNEVNFKLTPSGLKVIEIEAFSNSTASVRNLNQQERNTLISHSEKRGKEAYCRMNELTNPTAEDTVAVVPNTKVVLL